MRQGPPDDVGPSIRPLDEKTANLWKKMAGDPVEFLKGKQFSIRDLMALLQELRTRVKLPQAHPGRAILLKSKTDPDLATYIDKGNSEVEHFVGLFGLVRRLGFDLNDFVNFLTNQLHVEKGQEQELTVFRQMLEEAKAKVESNPDLPPVTRNVEGNPISESQKKDPQVEATLQMFARVAEDPVKFFNEVELKMKKLELPAVLAVLWRLRESARLPWGDSGRFDSKTSKVDSDVGEYLTNVDSDPLYYEGLFKVVRRLGFDIRDCIAVFVQEVNMQTSKGDLNEWTKVMEAARVKVESDPNLPPVTRHTEENSSLVKDKKSLH